MSFEIHPWKVVETGLDKERMRLSESLTSTGNGYMGMRGNFEEDYTGDTHLGTYIGGVWFPDKTRVGWWKNGYPLYFGKVINAVRLNGIHVEVDGETLDLNTAQVEAFYRELDMQNGLFLRRTVESPLVGSLRLVQDTSGSGKSAAQLIADDKCSAALDESGEATSLQTVSYSDTTWALLFNAADIIVVGRYTGHTALAAVGSTSALINLIVKPQ